MKKLEAYIQTLKVCLIIPTYNHASPLREMIQDCLLYPIDIIVVNDGSTDHTMSVISEFEKKLTSIVHYAKNRGKGFALKQGAKRAAELGYKAIITIDSDGQHFASDIETVVHAALVNPSAIVVGDRGLEHKNMPKKNSFANKFSNFWLAIQTFQKIRDTQSGFRYYPLQCINKKIWFTNRYNFELEILVRNMWNKVKVIPVPIKVYYAPDGKRITHFRPALDFFRIFVLNTFLTIIAIFYYYPRKIFERIFM